MTGWVKGNGSDLPDGTWAWIRWRAPKSERGYGMTVSWRREGGWGSNGEQKDTWEDSEFPDDGLGKMGWLGYVVDPDHEPTVVTHYCVIPEPVPPEDEESPSSPVQ